MLQPVSAKQLQLAAAVETVRAASPAMGDVEVIQRAREKVGGSKPSAEHIAMAADDQKRFQSEEAVWKAKIGKRSPCFPRNRLNFDTSQSKNPPRRSLRELIIE